MGFLWWNKKRKGIPKAVIREVDEVIRSFLAHHEREEIQYSLSAELNGNSIMIHENRPAFHSKKVEAFPVARVDYEHATGLWSLYCRDRNSCWVLYEPLEPTTDFIEILETVEEEPIFLG